MWKCTYFGFLNDMALFFSFSPRSPLFCLFSLTDHKCVSCRQGFVPAASVMNFRNQLGCDTFRTEEKGPYSSKSIFPKTVFLSKSMADVQRLIFLPPTADPEEFITVLFEKVLGIEPLLKLRYESFGSLVLKSLVCVADWSSDRHICTRSRCESYQGAYTFQTFLEKEQMAHIPTVQQLLDTSCLSCDVKFEEVW